MRVLFLGSGTSHGVPMIGCDCGVCTSDDPRNTRSRPSIVIEMEDGMQVLVDTTPDLRSQALKHHVRRVDAILYTHAHADHIMGMDDVRRFNVLSRTSMPAFAQQETIDELRRIFKYAFDEHAPRGGGVPSVQLWPIGGPFCLGRQEVVPVPVMHGPWRVLGFRVGGLAYLTDCNAIAESSIALLGGLDTLVIDALRRKPHPTHFSLDEAIAMATRIGARRTLFTHICHDLSHAETCAALPPGMSLAYDGLSLDIPTT